MLGDIAAERDGEPVPLSGPHRRLLAFLALHPGLDEPAHRLLIERLAAAGDRAGALVAGRDLAERLRAELGVGPAPAT